ncbi:hypothetical protein ABIC01_008811 [Bradyrhizobium sp. RT4b]
MGGRQLTVITERTVADIGVRLRVALPVKPKGAAMSNSKANIAIIGTGPRTNSLISLDLPDVETALSLGRKLVSDTGRKVIVHDQDGAVLDEFEPPRLDLCRTNSQSAARRSYHPRDRLYIGSLVWLVVVAGYGASVTPRLRPMAPLMSKGIQTPLPNLPRA